MLNDQGQQVWRDGLTGMGPEEIRLDRLEIRRGSAHDGPRLTG